MRKGLIASGLCGCLTAVPAVAYAANLDSTTPQPNIDTPTGTAANNQRVDAAAKRRAAREMPLHHHAVALAKRRARERQRAAAEAQQAAASGSSSGASTTTADTGSAAAGGSSQLQSIAACESSGDPSARSGAYGGLYQFDEQTWQSVGGTGDPASASPAEQTMRAEMLLQQRGTSAWPVCGQGR